MEVMRGLQSEEGHFEEEVKREGGHVSPSFRELVYFCSLSVAQKTLKITDSPHSDFKVLILWAKQILAKRRGLLLFNFERPTTVELPDNKAL